MSTVKLRQDNHTFSVAVEGHSNPQLCNQISTVMFGLLNYLAEYKEYDSYFNDGEMFLCWQGDSHIFNFVRNCFEMMDVNLIVEKDKN